MRLTSGQRGLDFMNTGVSAGWLKALLILGTPGFRCPLSSTMNSVLPVRAVRVPNRVPVLVMIFCAATGYSGFDRAARAARVQAAAGWHGAGGGTHHGSKQLVPKQLPCTDHNPVQVRQ